MFIRCSVEGMRSKLERKEKRTSVCRICDIYIPISEMNAHCENCVRKAEEKKKLIQMNLNLAKVSNRAYKLKHDL